MEYRFGEDNGSRVPPMQLFGVFTAVSLILGVLFQSFDLFGRMELKAIDQRFESRRWLSWNASSLERLNPSLLVDYHNKNENGDWLKWDKTSEWLLSENHPGPPLKVIVFERQVQEQPSLENVRNQPWMQPLLSYPLSRETLSELVSFLVEHGARAVCLNIDFPQYSSGDASLAQSVYAARSRKPVYLVDPVPAIDLDAGRSANTRPNSSGTKNGVILQLERLEPGIDVKEKYSAASGLLKDEDQSVRRIWIRLSGADGKSDESVSAKLVKAIGDSNRLPPEIIDVDYMTGPKGNVCPVRPMSYLFNPDLRYRICHETDDVSIKDAVVIIGDGVSDVYPTPLSSQTNRSGSEILAQALNTIAAGTWLQRMSSLQQYLYLLIISIIGGASLVVWRQNPAKKIARSSKEMVYRSIAGNLSLCFFNIACVYFMSIVLFSFANLIVPQVVPATAMVIATILTAIWEKDRIKANSLIEQARSSQETLVLSQRKHKTELAYRATLADQKVQEEDRRRRHEMVRRLNHDLKAPISVFNWTLAKLLKDRDASDPMYPIFQRLNKSSEHLSNLLSEIMKSLADEEEETASRETAQTCEITAVLRKQTELEKMLAEITGSEVNLELPNEDVLAWIVGEELEVARIVDNIVGNALKHNPPGTKVFVRLHQHEWSDDLIEVSIKDNGKGIAKDDLGKIFQSGFRVGGRPKGESSTSASEGLGLSIASSLANKMGGKINVESDLGVGTTFTIFFQRYRSEAEADSGVDESAGFEESIGETTILTAYKKS